MRFSGFKVLTFDVVGTLIDFERGIIDYVRDTAGDAIRDIDDETLLAIYRRSRASAGKRDRYPDDLERTWHELARELSLPEIPGAARGLVESVERWPAFDDSVAALKRLRRHFKLIAMTNARQWALEHMSRTLGHPFDDRVTVDDVRFEKPDPQFFAFARGRLSTRGLLFEDILHVAQSQYHDIGVAKRLGYSVAWIERRHAQPGSGGTLESEHTEPTFHFHSLAELADAIEAELG